MKSLGNNVLRTADVLKALGHPVRIEILRLIHRSKMRQLSVKEIQEALEIPQPETSKHLILMKNRSILSCQRKDGHSFYRISDEHSLIRSIINQVRTR